MFFQPLASGGESGWHLHTSADMKPTTFHILVEWGKTKTNQFRPEIKQFRPEIKFLQRKAMKTISKVGQTNLVNQSGVIILPAQTMHY